MSDRLDYRPGELLALDDTAEPSVIAIAYEDDGLWSAVYVGGLLLRHDPKEGPFTRPQALDGSRCEPRLLSPSTILRAHQLVEGPPPLELPPVPWQADLFKEIPEVLMNPLQVPEPLATRMATAWPVSVAGPTLVGGGLARRQTRAAAYAGAALEGELAKVSEAPHGQRNVTLNAAAFSLGQLIGPDGLDLDRVWWSLVGAARAAGLPDREIEATVTSGLRAGMSRPRRIA